MSTLSVVRRSLSAASNATSNATAAVVVAAAAAASSPWLVEKLKYAFGDSLWRDVVAFVVALLGSLVHVKMFDVGMLLATSSNVCCTLVS